MWGHQMVPVGVGIRQRTAPVSVRIQDVLLIVCVFLLQLWCDGDRQL